MPDTPAQASIPAAPSATPNTPPASTNKQKHLVLIIAVVFGALFGTGSAVMLIRSSGKPPTPTPTVAIEITPTTEPTNVPIEEEAKISSVEAKLTGDPIATPSATASSSASASRSASLP
jgi:hypothetical protein